MIPHPTPDYPIDMDAQLEAIDDRRDGIYVSSEMPMEEINKIRINENKDVYQLDLDRGILIKYPKPKVVKRHVKDSTELSGGHLW